MKKTFFTSLFLLFAICMMSCGSDSNDDTPTEPEVTLSQTELSFGNGEEQQSVALTATDEWSAYASEQWVTVSPKSSIEKSATLTVTVSKNTKETERQATVTVMSGTVRKSIKVTQAAGEKQEIDPSSGVPEGYEMVWNDEFDGSLLDTEKWTHEIKSAGWVNNELQNYVKSDGVTTVKDGKLLITCKKVNGKILSGRVYANYTKGWKYGYMEARIKLPKGKGTWPAFWMMPANNDYNSNPWPGCGEIDIMEEVGCNPNYVSSTIHCNKYNNGGSAIEHKEIYLPTAESDFHLYACLWTASHLKFYVDGKLTLDYVNDGSGKNAWPFDYNYYLILNLAWGGSWGGMNGVDESALPATMEVDYVRAYQKK